MEIDDSLISLQFYPVISWLAKTGDIIKRATFTGLSPKNYFDFSKDM